MNQVDRLIAAHQKLERLNKMLDSREPDHVDLPPYEMRLLILEQERLVELLGVRT